MEIIEKEVTDEQPEGVSEASAEKPQRPEFIPEKFWNDEKGETDLEALAKSYSELEKRASSAAGPIADDVQAGDVRTLVEAAGLNFNAMSDELAASGDLSRETRAQLTQAGFSEGQVNTYLAGFRAEGQQLLAAAHSAAGGQEQFEAMQEWAAGNLDEASQAAYNRLIASADPMQIKLAVQGLAAQYVEAEGSPAERTIGGNGNAGEYGDSYESIEQMKADMKKPEYKTDPAFRQKVMDRVSRSSAI